MARRNRKKNESGFVFPWQMALVLAGIAAFALTYVYLQSRAETLGGEIKMLEVKRDQLRERIVKQQSAWARMQSPANLEQALREHALVMTWPNRDQIVRVRADGMIDGFAGPESRPLTRSARADRIVMND
jgi:hypothetical protein